jgi:hypothetical protein
MENDDNKLKPSQFAAPLAAPPSGAGDQRPARVTEAAPAPTTGASAKVSYALRADARGTWREIGNKLTALIGESGFCALFARAVHLQVPRYQWLTVDPTRRSIEAILSAFIHDTSNISDAEATMANSELLHTFTRQLSILIGEALTARILDEAVASKPGTPDEAQEHE